jgi:hypothetical protein
VSQDDVHSFGAREEAHNAMNYNIQALAQGDACEAAKSRWHQAALFRLLYGIVTFVLSVVLLFVIILVIGLIIRDRPTAAIISGVGGLVDGVIVAFLLARRSEAVEEETAAFEALKIACADTPPNRSSFSLFGL